MSTQADKEPIIVSVITVCRNSEATIRDTIESVLHQTYNSIEYVLVDGLSTDHTMDIIRSYDEPFRERNIQYRYISEQDNGIYDAMNKGIQMASGELIGIINSDDWYEPEAIATAAAYYKREKYDLFYADLRIIGRKKDFIKRSKNGTWITSRYWNHPTTFIPKRLYEKYPYRNENIHDDWDLILRIRKDPAGCKVCVVNRVLANFRRNGVSHEKSIKKAWKRAKIKYGIYRDNGYSRWYAVECYGMELAKMVL
ncbi:MAG: glycosyltransferase [Lachnospiraceae bacterium]|nr:glycosyltransferase [Lachnospiraceae bacterium]